MKGVLHVARAALPAMIAEERGDLVRLGSVAGRNHSGTAGILAAQVGAAREAAAVQADAGRVVAGPFRLQ